MLALAFASIHAAPVLKIASAPPNTCAPNLSNSSYGQSHDPDEPCCCVTDARVKHDYDPSNPTYTCEPKQDPFGKPIFSMTHYYDGCRPSCAFSAHATRLVRTCEADGVTPYTPKDDDDNVCQGGTAATCQDQYPWIEDRVLYGFVAKHGDNVPCGQCYELTFTDARNIDSAIVMNTNGGDSSKNNMDLMVPGGGLGANTNGLTEYSGWGEFYDICPKDGSPSQCAVSGGLEDESLCDTIWGGADGDHKALQACHKVLFGVFGQLGCNQGAFPHNLHVATSKPVDCPQTLLDRAYGPVA